MKLRLAKKQDFEMIKNFYHQLIDEMKDSKFVPGWEREVYPSNSFLYESILAGELYVIEDYTTCAASMVMNHACNEGYNNVNWQIDSKKEATTVIHALGILPTYQGKGIAQFLLKEAIQLASEKQQSVIRLDVLGTNLPAKLLYEKMGFCYIETVKMFYEDTGWTEFLLYEYLL